MQHSFFVIFINVFLTLEMDTIDPECCLIFPPTHDTGSCI